ARLTRLSFISLLFVFFVYWSAALRALLSFPTRRSSDLISIFVCLSMVQLMAVFISMRCTLCGHFLQVALTLNFLPVWFALSLLRDRKSGSAGMPRPISYAVFCLKKKNRPLWG